MSRNFTAMQNVGIYEDRRTIAAVYPAGAITLGLLTKKGVLGKCVRGVKYEREFGFMPGAEGLVIEAHGVYRRDGNSGVYDTTVTVTRVLESHETGFVNEASFPSDNLRRDGLLYKAIADALRNAGITEASVSHMKIIPLFSGAYLAEEA